MKKPRDARMIGKAGEYAVAAQLMVRDILPFFPSVDSGVDILTSNGIRIQVKTSSRRYQRVNRSYAAYDFVLGQYESRYESGYVRRRGTRKFSAECDFIICWSVEENRFWIIPAMELDGYFKVALGAQGRWIDVDEETVRAQHVAGMSLRAIAEKHGVCYDLIDKVLKGTHAQSKKVQRRKRLNSYENAWHLIEEFSLLAEEQPDFEPVPTAAPVSQVVADKTKENF